jgi:hypothetical protein
MNDAILANADLVLATLRQCYDEPSLGYDAEGVRFLDRFINGRYEDPDDDQEPMLVQTLGSFLGECIRRSHGGEWVEADGSWAIRFSEGNLAFPFHKVRKQLQHGPEDSVLSFFNHIPVVFVARKTEPS